MAGWSSLSTGSVLDCVETNDAACHINGVFDDKDDVFDCNEVVDVVDDDDDDDDGDDFKVKQLRSTFDQVLSVFIEDVGDRGVVRPVPAVIGDRQPVDLFKLLCVVKDRCGYDSVSKNRLWSCVSEELGFDCGAAASLKLIFVKYLNEMEKWFRESCRSRHLGLSEELESDFRGLLLDRLEQKGLGDGSVRLGCNENEQSGFRCNGEENCNIDDDERVCSDDRNDVLVSLSSINKKENDRKRKRECLSGMLNWVIQIAKQPRDPSIGVIPGPTKWKEHEGNEIWAQALRAKKALLLKRNVRPRTAECLLQKKLKTHPLLYEDNIVAGHQSSERLRCRERLPISVKSRSCPCCSSCSGTHSNLISPRTKELDNDAKGQAPAEVDLLATDEMISPCDLPRKKHVRVGALFQADVPEWTGVAFESDIRLLGTQVWPLKCEEDSSISETDLFGQGRQDFCDCLLPGFVTCLRFHIAEARMKLKRELGSLFYHWRFDRMGEEVSLRWTAEEEKRFKDLKMSKSPTLWTSTSWWFPRRTRENVVNYYFNVFVILRRTYQNHVTPQIIDSDDDETELGSLSDGFRNNAVAVSANFLACSQNQQCTDLD